MNKSSVFGMLALGVGMLLLGLLLGYSGRPWLEARLNNGNTTPTPLSTVTSTPDPTLEAQRRLWMDEIIAQTRHFKGDASAPVTLIEFGDFQ